MQIPSEETLAPWEDQIYQWIIQDKLQFTRLQELLAQRGCRISYSALYRWLIRGNWQGRKAGTVRMEASVPGGVAELDFGRLGYIQDQETDRRRTVWELLVVLTYSRHSFLWPTYGQTLEDVIAGLEAAWAFFGGIPKYLVIDNFPAAVAGADALHPPRSTAAPTGVWNCGSAVPDSRRPAACRTSTGPPPLPWTAGSWTPYSPWNS